MDLLKQKPRVSSILNWLGLIVVTVLSSLFSIHFIIQPQNISALWLTNGVAVAWIAIRERSLLVRHGLSSETDPERWMRLDRRIMYVVHFVAVAGINFAAARPIGLILAFCISNSMEVIAAAYLLRRSSPLSNPLLTLNGAVTVVAGIPIVACGIGALGGAGAAALYFNHDFVSTAIYWILSDITGMIIVLPTALAFFAPDVRVIPSGREIVISALCCVTGVLFFCTPSDPLSYWQFPVLTLPLFVVCAARLPPMVMSITAVFVASVGLWSTVHGLGFYSITFSSFADRLHGAQAYAWAIVAVALWTSAATYELQAKSRTIQKQTRAKSRFLAAMSHEVRTPMTAILGVTEELIESDLTATQRQALEVIQDSSRSLVRIVNDILDEAKIEEGKMAVVTKPCNVFRLLNNLTTGYHALAKQSHVIFECLLSIDSEEYVSCDEGRLRQVLNNLVSNAIKFTPADGFVTLQALTSQANDQSVTYQFIVSDTGSGIAASAQTRIFKPYEQEDEFIQAKYGGTGLGLSIAYQLVELMGGELRVSSKLGIGTAFIFTLTFDRCKPEAKNLFINEEEVPHGARVLVADDNPVNQRILSSLLGKLNCSVTIASNGLEAIRLVGTIPFDMILMDISMPEMDGLEATRILRASPDPRISKLPIMAVTAHALAGDKEDFLNQGFDGYIAKPFEAAEVRRIVRETLSKRVAD